MVDKSGTFIAAPEAGSVLEARKSTAPGGGYGYYVKIKGNSGAVHILAHMIAGSLAVRAGGKVKAGEVVGRMGTTGASTGVHLHWEVQINGVPVDPIKWLEENSRPTPSAGTTRSADGTSYRVRISNVGNGAKIAVTNNGANVFRYTVKTDSNATTLTKEGLPLAMGKNRIVISVDGKVLKEVNYTRK
jgi:hypothetical protein